MKLELCIPQLSYRGREPHIVCVLGFQHRPPDAGTLRGISQSTCASGQGPDCGSAALGMDLPVTYSCGHLPSITGYKWDYTFYKWGYKYLYLINGHNCMKYHTVMAALMTLMALMALSSCKWVYNDI